jgi:beta-glucanase (GH16 family)
LTVANYQTDFHTYGMGWTPNRMDFYVDGQLFWSVMPASLRSNVWKFNEPFFLILNNAVGFFGGNYDGWASSQMTIDYVRAWKLDGQGTVTRH